MIKSYFPSEILAYCYVKQKSRLLEISKIIFPDVTVFSLTSPLRAQQGTVNDLMLGFISNSESTFPDSKVHGANMGPTWVL